MRVNKTPNGIMRSKMGQGVRLPRGLAKHIRLLPASQRKAMREQYLRNLRGNQGKGR